MTEENKAEGKKILTLGARKAGGNTSQQSRNIQAQPQVKVEVKKQRVFIRDDRGNIIGSQAAALPKKNEASEQTSLDGIEINKNLTSGERNKRLMVLQQAHIDREREVEEQQRKAVEQEKIEEELRQKAEENEQLLQNEPKEIAAELKTVELKQAQEPAKQPLEQLRKVTSPLDEIDEESEAVTKKKSRHIRPEEAVPAKTKRDREDERRNVSTGKLKLDVFKEEEEDRVRSLSSIRRARQKEKARRTLDDGTTEEVMRDIIVPEFITVQELANRMATRVTDVIRSLMKMGMVVTSNQTIDADTAELVVQEFGHRIHRVADSDVEAILKDIEDRPESLKPRPPVVTIMGHVDHGKTSLLDALRETDVVAREAGGITQHIGAYQIVTEQDQQITFIDTPGHEAFTEMRSRGAKVTDIVVLVVAADDGIMAQTVEAINHAKAAQVPIIVAVNKIDKPAADSQRVRNELLSHNLIPEEFGGDIICVDVSAKAKLNLDKLEEAILTQAEILELKANPNRAGRGAIIESRVDKNRGVVATVLVQKGTLKQGDLVVAGLAYGKVRTIADDKGRAVSYAEPSMPVEITGLSEAPLAGEVIAVVDSERQARDIVEYRLKRRLDQKAAASEKMSLEDLFARVSEGAVKELPIVVRADVQGSLEAITASLEKLSTSEVTVRVLHGGVGAVTESDVSLAGASNAIVICFNVRPNAAAKDMAHRDKVDMRYYSIIYNLVDDVKAALSGMLQPNLREQYLGTAEIREVFNLSKFGKIAGCFVKDGMIKRGCKVRLLRDNVVIHDGDLKTLRRFKDDVKEVGTSFECGMAFENYSDLKAGDMIEAYEIIVEKRSL